MSQTQSPETDHAPQGTQAWTAPSLIRLDADAAEGNGGGGPDFASEAS